MIGDLDKVCMAHNIKPSDGFTILRENEYKDYLKWVCGKECAQKLVGQLIQENEEFEKTMEMDFIEQLMNR